MIGAPHSVGVCGKFTAPAFKEHTPMSTQPLQACQAIQRNILEQVQADQMSNPTPCASWDVAGLINHVVGAQHFFAAGALGQPPAGGDQDFAAGDYLAAYDEGVQKCADAFGTEGVLEAELTLPFGNMSGQAFMGMAMTDTFQHAWDLAKATGQSTDLDAGMATQLHGAMQNMIQPGFRGEDGAAPFGAEQECADGSCAADQLAAFLGREV